MENLIDRIETRLSRMEKVRDAAVSARQELKGAAEKINGDLTTAGKDRLNAIARRKSCFENGNMHAEQNATHDIADAVERRIDLAKKLQKVSGEMLDFRQRHHIPGDDIEKIHKDFDLLEQKFKDLRRRIHFYSESWPRVGEMEELANKFIAVSQSILKPVEDEPGKQP